MTTPNQSTEPTAWMWRNKNTGAKGCVFAEPVMTHPDYEWALLYTAPPAQPAQCVPQGIPAHEVIDAIEAWKSAWLKVPAFGNKVNRATREAITISHNSLFMLLQSAQQAQRMPVGCPTPTGCGPHGCHGACLAATPAPAPAQEPVTLTDEEIKRIWSNVHRTWPFATSEHVAFGRAIIAALRAKEAAK